MKINFLKSCRNTEVLTSRQTHMTETRQRREEQLELKDVFTDFPASFITKRGRCPWIFQNVPPNMILLWDGPNGSPVRWSKFMRAKWRLLSSMRRPEGHWGEKIKWFVMVDETDDALREELTCVENWSEKSLAGLLPHTLLWVIYTGALRNKTALWFALEGRIFF